MTPTLYIDGIALWWPTLPGWPSARGAFRGEAEPLATGVARPASSLLPPAEQRRIPDSVAIALAAATEAVAQSGRAAGSLPSVFVSAHGDLAINHYLCSTLARAPTMLSPTRFHNSVLNAPAGYWTIGTGCMQSSTALTAYDRSFANGLLEAASQCAADDQAVLLVGNEVPSCGPLVEVSPCVGLLAVALVIAPVRSAASIAAFDWTLHPGPPQPTPVCSAPARSLAGNTLAHALPLFEALALESTWPLHLALSDSLSITVTLKAV